MPGKWWLMSPIETPASALMRRTETPSCPSLFKHASVAVTSSSRRASGASRRNFGSAAVLDRFTGPGAQEAKPAVDVFLVEVHAGQAAVAGVGVARVQHAPVVEQQHRARQQPAAMLQAFVPAECVELRERPVERTLALGRQRERRAVVAVVAQLHEPTGVVE